MLIKEIKAEIWYVLILWIIITWGIVICDINQRIESHDFCQNWEYNLDAPIPTGWEDSMYKEPKYKPKYRMKNKAN